MLEPNLLPDFDSATATVIAKYTLDLLARGITSGIGKDIWDKIKLKPKTKVEEMVVQNYESSSNDNSNGAKLEFLLENWIDSDNEFKDSMLNLLRKYPENLTSQNVVNSKNVILNSSILTQQGNIHIGDNK